MHDDAQVREEICSVGRHMHTRGLVAGGDGNISARAGEDRVLITPSGSCLGMLAPEDMVLIDFDGHVLSGEGKPSTEWWMHVAAYRRRPDIRAVVHAHPPYCVAMTVAGIPLPQRALPEVIIVFGRIPVTKYATPTTSEGAGVIQEYIERYDALVLDRHGSLTVGRTVTDAMHKLDKLEHGVQIMLLAHQLGGARDLPPEEVAKLAGLRESLGFGRADDVAPATEPDNAN